MAASKPQPASPTSPARATFKHNLPAAVSDGYFDSLESFLAKECPSYQQEAVQVNQDLIACAQLAAVGLAEEASPTPLAPFCTGKSLNSPTRDTYNGPLQAFLQHSLSSFGKQSVWQHWVKCRDQLVEDFTLFSRRAFRGEVRIVDAPKLAETEADSGLSKRKSFHGGNLSGSFASGSFGGLSKSGSFAGMSPLSRRDTFARLPGDSQPQGKIDADSTEVYIKRGLNTYMDPERLVMIHVWDNPRACRLFVQMWQRAAQVLFENRIELFHAPVSVVNIIDGTFVSVTAIPPIADTKKFPPLRNVGVSESTQLLSDHVAEQFIRCLNCDHEERPLKEGLTLYPGLDGRFYLMDIPLSLLPTFGPGEVPSPFIIPRAEGLYRRLAETAQESVPIASFVVDYQVPKALEHLLQAVSKIDSPTVDLIVRENRLSLLLHEFGINVCFLGELYTQTAKFKPRSPQEEVNLLLIQSAVATEIVGRTLKHMIRIDCHVGAAGSKDRDLSRSCTNERGRIDVVNRIARLIVGKRDDFLENHILPIARKKFRCPTFVTTWAIVNPGTCLKLISARTGAEFSQSEGRFFRFVPCASKDLVVVACNSALEGLLCDDLSQTEAGCKDVWAQCDGSPEGVLHETLLIRASALSIITNSCKNKVPLNLVTTEAGSSLHHLFHLQLTGLFGEVLTKETKKTTTVQDFLSRLKGYAAEAAAKNPVNPESTYYSLKLLQAAPLIESVNKQASISPEFLEEGVKVFLSQPHVDFVYSAQHAQALRDIEGMIPVLTEPQIQAFLEGTVDSILDALQNNGRIGSAAKYAARVTTQLIGVTAAETCNQASKTARLSYTLHLKAFGLEDPRTTFALYTLGVLALSSTKSSSAQGALSGCRKVFQKALSLPPAQQTLFYKTWNVFLVLQKTMQTLEQLGDILTANSFKSHLTLLGRVHYAVMLIQSCGRGLMVRKRKDKHFEGAPPPLDTFQASISALQKSGSGSLSPLISPIGSQAHRQQPPAATQAIKLPPALAKQSEVTVSNIDDDSQEDQALRFRRKPTFTQGTQKPVVQKLTLEEEKTKPDSKNDGESSEDSLFRLCDTDGDGFVSTDDCVGVFSTFNVMSPSELRSLFNAAVKQSKNGNGKLNQKEFASVVVKAGL
jgi:hypothetical protein